MKKTTARWPHAAAGVILMLFLGSMYAWSYFKVTLASVFPSWSEKQITMNFTLMMCIFCLGGVLAGRISRWLSKPVQIAISGVLMCIGFLGVSFLPANAPGISLVLLYLFYAGFNGLGTGIAFNAVLAAVQPWYPDHSGLISGLLLMGLGFGSLILGNAAGALIAVMSLFPTFRLFGIADLVVMLALAPLIRTPTEADQVPAAPKTAKEKGALELTTAEMIRRPTFWIYFCWNICMSASGLLVINSASSISIYYGAAAGMGLLVSVFNGGGRLVVGWLMDQIGWKASLFLINGIQLLAGLSMLLGDRSGFAFPVFAGMMLLGVCYGSGITICASLIRKLYGNAHYASNMGVANLCTFPAALIGPMIAAALQDASTGYTSTFIMVIIIGCIALAANCFIRKP